jgi:hypothetical protein
MRTSTPTIGLRCGIQRRSLLQKQWNHGPGQFIALIFPFDELAARQRHRIVGWNHLVEDGLKNLAEPFTSLLPIRQR